MKIPNKDAVAAVSLVMDFIKRLPSMNDEEQDLFHSLLTEERPVALHLSIIETLTLLESMTDIELITKLRMENGYPPEILKRMVDAAIAIIDQTIPELNVQLTETLALLEGTTPKERVH